MRERDEVLVAAIWIEEQLTEPVIWGETDVGGYPK